MHKIKWKNICPTCASLVPTGKFVGPKKQQCNKCVIRFTTFSGNPFAAGYFYAPYVPLAVTSISGSVVYYDNKGMTYVPQSSATTFIGTTVYSNFSGSVIYSCNPPKSGDKK